MSRALVPVITALSVACLHPSIEVQRFTSGADGFDTHSHWIDTGSEVIVFDAQFTPQLAEALLEEIRSATDSPVRYVVITHPNPDKFNGASVLQEQGARVIASEATAAAMPEVHAYKEAYFTGAGTFEAGAYPTLPSVDEVFSGDLELQLGGSTLHLFELSSPGVASTQTVAQVGEHVFVGDLAAGRTHAWLEGGIVQGVATPDVEGWIAALSELEARIGADAIVHPGRGDSLPAGELLPAQRGYLTAVDEIVASYVERLDEPAVALAADPEAHWGALTSEIEAAYPDHALPYLITYGVYGLAFQHATR